MGRRKKPEDVTKIEQAAARYLGKKLREWRKRNHMALTDAAKSTGISFSTISEYERGLYFCPPDRLRKLAALYGAPMSEFKVNEHQPLETDAKQIAQLLKAWPEDERAEIVTAVLSYINTLSTLSGISPPED